MEPPSTVRVGFQMVQKTVMAMLDQQAAQPIAASACGPAVGSASRCLRPPVSVPTFQLTRRGDVNGPEIGQQSGGKSGEVGHRAGI